MNNYQKKGYTHEKKVCCYRCNTYTNCIPNI